jgi:hypothetical protein
MEAIPMSGGAAQAGRESDPVLLERLGRLAFERRRVALDDPIGVYIQDVQCTRLVTPDGSAVPREWFTFSRGSIGDDGYARHQRLVFEVPSEERLTIGDLVDVATEQTLRYGGQVADLIRLAVFARASPPDPAAPAPELVRPAGSVDDCEGCAEVRRRNAGFLAEHGIAS